MPRNIRHETADAIAESAPDLFREGLSRHRDGDFVAAEAAYRKLLAIDARHARALHCLGVLMMQTDRAQEGVALLDWAIAIAPGYAEALNNRGVALRTLERFDDALASFDRALAVKPDHVEACCNRADALRALGRFEEALAGYEQTLALKPDHGAALHNRGVALQALGRAGDALAAYDEALRLNPGAAESHNNRGHALQKLGRLDDALADYDRALEIAPDYPEALINRGTTLRELGRVDEALACYDRALALRPDADGFLLKGVALQLARRDAEALAAYDAALALAPNFANALNNKGIALHELRRCAEALACYDRALAIRPSAEIHINRGNTLQRLNRLDEALAAYDRALQIKPGSAEAFDCRGNAMLKLGRFDAALACFDKALALRPDDPDAAFNRGFLMLLKGDLAQGWRGYQRRWDKKTAPELTCRLPFPVWRGEPIGGKTIIVYEEQGFGDVIQFFRYLGLLVEKGAKVTFVVRASLLALLRPGAEAVRMLTAAPEDEAFDFQCALLSLPLAFGATLDAIPARIPYLRADGARVRTWRDRLGTQGFRVGIAWQGSRTDADLGRSPPLAAFLGLAAIPGVRLISLQKNDGVEQLAALPEGMAVETLGADFDAGDDAFLDTAAAMENLDLVISSDTSVAHLAGALGRPVWLALKHAPDWRWMLERSDSPWYPTMRLFRQRRRDDWRAVFTEIERALRAWIDAGEQPAAASGPAPEARSSDERERRPSPLPMEGFVISLERTPERLQQFRQANGGIADFRHFRAIDGARVDRARLCEAGLLESETTFGPGLLGAALSHLTLWEQIAKSRKAALICEDDALLSAFFPVHVETFVGRLRPDWDLILWGWNFDSVLCADMSPALCPFVARFDQDAMRANMRDYLRAPHTPTPLKVKRAFGLCCYSISPAGARKLLGFARPLRVAQVFVPGVGLVETESLDAMLNCVYDEIVAFAAWPPVAITPNDHDVSTTVAKAGAGGQASVAGVDERAPDV